MYDLGLEYLSQGDFRQTVDHLELARREMPNPTIAVLYKLDRALRKLGENQKSAKVRAQARMFIAQNSQVNLHFQQAQILEFRYNYALALCRVGRWQEGISKLHEVLENDPGDVEDRRALFIAMDKSKGRASGATSAKSP